MKNKKIIAIFVMLVLAATSILVASAQENDRLDVSVNGEIPPIPNPFMITELSEGWNMIGYPNQGIVDLDVLSIIYNDEIYTWTEAWEQQIILRFVYSWDREQQWYVFVDEIEGGYGYWMFSYEDCELWSLY